MLFSIFIVGCSTADCTTYIIFTYAYASRRMASRYWNDKNYNMLMILGGPSNPEVVCCTSDHWVAGSNPLGGMFHH